MPGLVFATGMPLITAVGTSLLAVGAFGLATATNYALSGMVIGPSPENLSPAASSAVSWVCGWPTGSPATRARSTRCSPPSSSVSPLHALPQRRRLRRDALTDAGAGDRCRTRSGDRQHALSRKTTMTPNVGSIDRILRLVAAFWSQASATRCSMASGPLSPPASCRAGVDRPRRLLPRLRDPRDQHMPTPASRRLTPPVRGRPTGDKQ